MLFMIRKVLVILQLPLLDFWVTSSSVTKTYKKYPWWVWWNMPVGQLLRSWRQGNALNREIREEDGRGGEEKAGEWSHWWLSDTVLAWHEWVPRPLPQPGHAGDVSHWVECFPSIQNQFQPLSPYSGWVAHHYSLSTQRVGAAELRSLATLWVLGLPELLGLRLIK